MNRGEEQKTTWVKVKQEDFHLVQIELCQVTGPLSRACTQTVKLFHEQKGKP